MKTTKVIAIVLMGFALFSCKKEIVMYENPVLDRTFPDPTIIRGGDGLFYAYATQGITPQGTMTNIQVAKSEDLVNWKYVGDALPKKPAWASETQNFWAPHVVFADNKYFLYFSAEPNVNTKTGEELGLGLGVAVSDSPEGPFVPNDTAMIKGNTFVNIDPMAFDDPVTGKKLLYWGSGFEPIKVRELNADRMSFKKDAPAIELVKAIKFDYQFLVEAAWV
ncbi:MAG TPA: family 43 glycosylhydrolase, partial [Bacteroidales bacterium]